MTPIVIDSSALVAVFLNEPERARFIDLILADDRRLLSAATLVEAAIVLESRTNPVVVRELDLFLHDS